MVRHVPPVTARERDYSTRGRVSAGRIVAPTRGQAGGRRDLEEPGQKIRQGGAAGRRGQPVADQMAAFDLEGANFGLAPARRRDQRGTRL